jgi:hypothetical protein
VWVLYKQTAALVPTVADAAAWASDVTTARLAISVKDIASRYSLGDPVGINWSKSPSDPVRCGAPPCLVLSPVRSCMQLLVLPAPLLRLCCRCRC